jgi:diguanylate cyclase (GGDEF)-like protein
MNRIVAPYINKQLTAGILRNALAVLYVLIIAATAWLLREFSPEYIFSRIVPYGIPPLISLLCAAFLSLFVLHLERIRTETLLFSIISLAFAGLNLDVFLLGVIKDPQTALMISRVDHFLLALVMLGANLHLAYLVCEKKDKWAIVYSAYAVGAVMAVFTPTDFYFKGVYSYFWGFFAKKAILYDLMSFLWLAGTLYCIYILFFAFRRTSDRHKKDTIKFLLLGFVSTAVLSLTNTPAIYGYEIYPLGTFTFIPLLLLAYGLFKYNLRIALQQLRAILFTIGHLVLVVGAAFVPAIFFPGAAHQFKLGVGIILVALLYHPLYKLWDHALSLVFKRPTDLLQKELYALTLKLSEVRHLQSIHHEISKWFFRIFINSRCATIFADAHRRVYKGWRSVNADPFSGFFRSPPETPSADEVLVIRADHPILQKIISTRVRLATHVMIHDWMRETGIVNPASDTNKESDDRLLQAGIIIPVFSVNELTGLVLIGNRLNDRSYTSAEKEIFANIGAILGPVIENANLLEDLEDKIQVRTRDLHAALKTLEQKNRKISEHHAIIKKQNHIFLSLFQTATRIHHIDELHELFGNTLNQLRSLFPHLGFGIIHEGERSKILESGAFIGISEKEQAVILEHRQHLTPENINQLMIEKMQTPEEAQIAPGKLWTLRQMQVRENRVIGKIIVKGSMSDPFTGTVIAIFLAQVSAAAYNKLLMNKLETSANTDSLTGVCNRAFFDRELKKTIKNAVLFPVVSFSVIMIDINGLKRVNDKFGHDKGDEMIRAVAELLRSVCRETDTLSRMGGDEFIILLPSTTSAEANVTATRIRDREKTLSLVCRLKNHRQASIPIRFSMGVAGSDETTPEKVMKLADQRMYIDKENFYQKTVESIHFDHS